MAARLFVAVVGALGYVYASPDDACSERNTTTLGLTLSKPLGLRVTRPMVNGKPTFGAIVGDLLDGGSALNLDNDTQKLLINSRIMNVNNKSVLGYNIEEIVHLIYNAPSPVEIEFILTQTKNFTNNETFDRQVQWVQSKGGIINPKIEFRTEDRHDPSSLFGIFARRGIEKGEVLLAIPWDCILGRAMNEDYFIGDCNVVERVVKELNEGEESPYAPYVASLKETLRRHSGLIPSSWSNAGKKLLLQVSNGHELPPADPFSLYREIVKNPCSKEDAPARDKAHYQNVAFLLKTHGEDNWMMPLSEKFNHDKKLVGARLKFPSSDDPYGYGLIVESTRQVKEGEQIYTDYRSGHYYGALDYTTAELFSDFGFVEQYPQRWRFHTGSQAIGFDLENSDDDCRITWHVDKRFITEESVSFLREHLIRLRQLDDEIEQSLAPQSERESVRQFREAMMIALSCSIQKIDLTLNQA